MFRYRRGRLRLLPRRLVLLPPRRPRNLSVLHPDERRRQRPRRPSRPVPRARMVLAGAGRERRHEGRVSDRRPPKQEGRRGRRGGGGVDRRGSILRRLRRAEPGRQPGRQAPLRRAERGERHVVGSRAAVGLVRRSRLSRRRSERVDALGARPVARLCLPRERQGSIPRQLDEGSAVGRRQHRPRVPKRDWDCDCDCDRDHGR
mmetsp:Transcript_57812/g.172585  ORF Transcript_57812/g.172585 Transcript_57812/m.172585 type:complete len:203 (-) Transcript_57812:1707-2315(-)